jgi:hypothetical protein
MSAFEYFLVALVILLPLAIAVTVTLWTLEQARSRNKRNRRPQDTRAVTETVSIERGAAPPGHEPTPGQPG